MIGGKMRSVPEIVAGLAALADHIASMDSGSDDAALLRDAANYINGATDSLREHMDELRKAREECADRIDFLNRLGRVTEELSLPFDATGSRIVEAIRAYSDFERSMGFFDGRDRAVAILMRKAHAGEDDDLTPIEEAIREQLIYAAREIRELKPKDQAL